MEKENLENAGESDSLYQELVEIYPNAIALLNRDGVILNVNPQALAIARQSKKDMVGKNFFDYIPREDHEFILTMKEEADKNGKVIIPEVILTREDGIAVVTEFSISTLKDSGGSIKSYLMVYSDITERKKLQDMWRRYEFIANTSPEFMTLINRRYEYEAVNEAFVSALNMKREDIMGKPVAGIWGKEVFDREIKGYLDICFSGRIENYESFFSFGALGQRFIEVSYYPYYDTKKNVTHAVVVSRDITERRIAEKALRESEETSRALLNANSDSVLLLDVDGSILAVNDMAVGWLVRTFNNLIGEKTNALANKSISLYDYLPQEDVIARKEIIDRMIHSGEPIRFESESDGRISDYNMYPVSDEGGKVNRVAIFARDITQRKKAEKVLQYMVEFERIIGTISANFINLHSNEIDIGIIRALETVGNFHGDEAGYVFLVDSNDDKMMINTHKWRADGPKPVIGGKAELIVPHLRWFSNKIKKFEIITIPDVSAMPKAPGTEKKILESDGLMSFIAVPMISQRTLKGFIGFGSLKAKKEWPEQAIPLFEMISLIFVNAIERKQMENELLDIFMSRLSDREVELLRLLAGGLSWPKDKRLMGKKMDVLPGTLDKFLARIKEKMNIEDLDKMMKVLNVHLKPKEMD